MKYSFFSRKNGFKDGFPVRYYQSQSIEDKEGITQEFVDKSGSDILKILDTFNKKVNENFVEMAKQNLNWYYYPTDTKITDIRTLE